MRTTATRHAHENTPAAVLFLACALREKPWKRGFSIGHGHKPRERPMAARDRKRLLDEVAQAKSRCGLDDNRAGGQW